MIGASENPASPIRRQVREQLSSLTIVLVAAVLSFGVYFLFKPAARPSNTAAPAQSAQSAESGLGTPPSPQLSVDPAKLPILEIGKTLEFGIDKDGHPYQANAALLSGWSVPESGGIWSLGKNAEIGFRIRCAETVCPRQSGVLWFEGTAFVVAGHSVERIEARINDRVIDRAALANSTANFAISLDGVDLKDGMPLLLSLHFPDAIVQGAVIVSNDPRELAFRIKSLRLER